MIAARLEQCLVTVAWPRLIEALVHKCRLSTRGRYSLHYFDVDSCCLPGISLFVRLTKIFASARANARRSIPFLEDENVVQFPFRRNGMERERQLFIDFYCTY